MAFTGKLGHLTIESPWGNAGGVAKSPEELEIMGRTGVGWVEGGSYTINPREGNAPNGEIVYRHDLESEITFNSPGMPNKGLDVVISQIPDMKAAIPKPVVINVAPVSEDPVSESFELITRVFEAGADAVLLNAGCPNVVLEDGERHELLSRNPYALSNVLSELKPVVQKFKPIFIRTSPLENLNQAKQIYQVIVNSGIVSAVFTSNAWPTSPDESKLEAPTNVGGKSGPGMSDEASIQTLWAVNEFRGTKIDVVSSIGIATGRELARRLGLGAVAGAGTTLYYQSAERGISWSESTDKILREYSQFL